MTINSNIKDEHRMVGETHHTGAVVDLLTGSLSPLPFELSDDQKSQRQQYSSLLDRPETQTVALRNSCCHVDCRQTCSYITGTASEAQALLERKFDLLTCTEHAYKESKSGMGEPDCSTPPPPPPPPKLLSSQASYIVAFSAKKRLNSTELFINKNSQHQAVCSSLLNNSDYSCDLDPPQNVLKHSQSPDGRIEARDHDNNERNVYSEEISTINLTPHEHKLKSRQEKISTIDFNRDRVNYVLQQQNASDRFPHGLKALLLKSEGWLYTAIIAMLTGLAAAWIEICVKYLSDFRIGVCRGMLWQDRNSCCGSRAAVDYKNNACFANESPFVHMDLVDHAKWLSWSQVFSISNNLAAKVIDYTIYVNVSVIFAMTAAWFCYKFAPTAAGSGIPEVKTILGGFVMKGVLSSWTALIKCVGLSLGAASGLALGKEGPLVHIACCFANSIGRLSIKFSDNEGKKRELLSAASAAGVSVAFGAPLGGVLFSLEEVSSYFPPKTLWKSFFGAVVGALTLKSVDYSGSSRLTLFQMDSVSLLGSWQLVELIPFAFLGLLGGTIGTMLIRFNVYWMEQKKRYTRISLGQHPIYEVAGITLICGLINYPFKMLRVPSASLLEQMFWRCRVNTAEPDIFSLCSAQHELEHNFSDYSLKWGLLAELLFTAVIKFLEVCLTFGMGLPAGVFIPSLTIGAICGRMVGLFTIKLNSLLGFIECHKCIHPGVYAIVGAAAMLGGVTRVTISIVVIMFELTGGLSYVVPFMVSVIIAKWIGETLCEHSIYDCFIRLKGYPYLNNNENHAFTAKARDIMDTKLVVITLKGNTIATLKQKLARYPYSGFPLVNTRADRLLLGFISAAELHRALERLLVDDNRQISPDTKVQFLSERKTRDRSSNAKLGVPNGGEGRMSDCESQSSVSSGINKVTENNNNNNNNNNSSLGYEYIGFIEEEEEVKEQQKISTLNLSHLVDFQTILLVPDTPLGQIHNIFRQLGLRFCLLTHCGRLEGLLTKRKFLAYVEKLHEQYT